MTEEIVQIAKLNARKAEAEYRKARAELRKARIEAGELPIGHQLDKASKYINEKADFFRSKIMRHALRALAGALIEDHKSGEELVNLDEKLLAAEKDPERLDLITKIEQGAKAFRSKAVRLTLETLAKSLRNPTGSTLLTLDHEFYRAEKA